MALLYAIGDALVDKEEIHAEVTSGKLQEFQKALASGRGSANIKFLSGTANEKNVLGSLISATGKPIDFEPIGIGKPLTVQIRHIYTGNVDDGLWSKNDMLVASAMRSVSTFDAAPRAVNFLVHKTPSNRNFRTVNATEKGTSLIYYTHSLAQVSSVITVEVMFSAFDNDVFDAVSQAFSAAAGIPVFAPASGYLVATGLVTKLLGSIGKKLFNGTPALKQTEEITFITPGSLEAIARFVLLTSDGIPQETLKDYKVNKQGALARVNDENQLYDGEYPYVVISLDGRQVDEYKSFTSTAASAALLDKFYNITEGGSQPLTMVVDAFKLYNDMKFRDQAINQADKLKEIDKATDDYKSQLSLYNAYVKNIGTKELRPPDIS
ncbi:MAG: hypothetical protein H8K03_12080 [Nitrospira sp.]